MVSARVARHTERLDEIVAFYRDGLGLEGIGGNGKSGNGSRQ